MLQNVAESFARFTAYLDRDYIFAWLDWDGDNVLASAGIIDYGSVRQFGLRHDQYRYDDIDRFSTNLNEQKLKARLILQVFAQMVDFLETGIKKPLSHFKSDPVLKHFDQRFNHHLMDRFLYQLRTGSNASPPAPQPPLPDRARVLSSPFRIRADQNAPEAQESRRWCPPPRDFQYARHAGVHAWPPVGIRHEAHPGERVFPPHFSSRAWRREHRHFNPSHARRIELWDENTFVCWRKFRPRKTSESCLRQSKPVRKGSIARTG